MHGWRRVQNVMSRLALVGMLIVGLVGLTAFAADAPKLRIEKVWARPGVAMAATPGNSAIYMVIHNDGAAADRLIGATADIAKAVEIHQTKVEGGMAQMMRVAGIDVPAKSTVELKPGGFHVMLVGLRRDLKAGEKFPVTLRFQKAGRITLTVEVRTP
jgi:copper(I)-binding protein